MGWFIPFMKISPIEFRNLRQTYAILMGLQHNVYLLYVPLQEGLREL